MVGKHYRIDGVGHNPAQPEWGSTRQLLDFVALREAYDDGRSEAAGPTRPSARRISIELFGPERYAANTINFINQWVPAFAEFVLHDLYLPRRSSAWLNVTAPRCDPVFDAQCQGNGQIGYLREAGNITDGAAYERKRNDATTWLDLSMVYSSSAARLSELRDGVNGTLRISKSAKGHHLPPYSLKSGEYVFETGDPRAMDSLGVLSLHSLFALEHNRLARGLHDQHPSWTDQELFAEARRINIAVYQKVVFYEFLPKLLSHHLPDYLGAVTDLNPVLDPAAVTALEAYIRSATPPNIFLVDEWRAPAKPGYYAVDDRDAIGREPVQYGLDRVVRGLMLQPAAAMDLHVVAELRNSPYQKSDLVAVDIQAGRDRGLPPYNEVRAKMSAAGLPRMNPVTSFAQITPDPAAAARASALYGGNVSNLDLIVGAMMEPVGYGKYALPHSLSFLLTQQFTRLRDADPLYFEISGLFDAELLQWIKDRTVCEMITDLTGVQWMPDALFHYQPALSFELFNSFPASTWRTFSPLPEYQMRWMIQGDIWHAEIVTQLGGWAAVGFGTVMRGSDVIQCFINDDGSPGVLDSKVGNEYDYVMAPLPDERVGGAQSIMAGYSVTRDDGVLTCRFSRKLSTGDLSDHIITDSVTPMIFAHGAAPAVGQHGVYGRAQWQLNLFSPPAASEFLSESQQVGLIASSSSAMGLYLTILVAVAVKSKARIVIMSGPTLLALTLLGFISLNAFTILSAVAQTAGICACRLAASLVAVSLLIFPSVMKLWRYYRIFNYSMTKVVRIRNELLFAITLAIIVADIVVVTALWGNGDISMSAAIVNKCELSSTAIITFLVVLGLQGAVLVAGLYLMVALLSMDDITITHVRMDIKAEGFFLATFVVLLSVFVLVLGLLAQWVLNVTLTVLAATFAVLLSVLPALVLLYLKLQSFITWSQDSNKKTNKTRSHTQNSAAVKAAASQGHMHAPSSGIMATIRRSIDVIAMRADPNSERARLQKLRDELEVQFDACQRDLNVQNAAASKTKQRLQSVKQQILIVEDELEVVMKQNPQSGNKIDLKSIGSTASGATWESPAPVLNSS